MAEERPDDAPEGEEIHDAEAEMLAAFEAEQKKPEEGGEALHDSEAEMLAAFEAQGEAAAEGDDSLHDAEAEMLAAFAAPEPAEEEDGSEVHLERVLNMRLPVIAVLAEKEMTLQEVLNLKRDGIITFKKQNNEPLEFFVNDCQIGCGKAIKIGEQFGLWIDEIKSVKDRLEEIA